VPYFSQIIHNLTNSQSFRSSFIVNTEPIKPILNGIFVNKYGKIQCSLRNYEKFILSYPLLIFDHIRKYSVYRYSDLTSLISVVIDAIPFLA
jgi:hypothetical protein